MYSGIHIFFELFLKRRREVLGKTSVGGNFGRTSVGRNHGRASVVKKSEMTWAGGRCKDVGRRKSQKVVGRLKSRKIVGRKKKSKGCGKVVVVRTSVGRNFERSSVGRNLKNFQLRRPFTTGCEEEEDEEENFICFKSPQTPGGGWHGCRALWHQATILVSKPIWVCKSTKV